MNKSPANAKNATKKTKVSKHDRKLHTELLAEMRLKTKTKLAEMKAEMDEVRAEAKAQLEAERAKVDAKKATMVADLVARAEAVVKKRTLALAKSEYRLKQLKWAVANPLEVAKAKAAKVKARKVAKKSKK